MICRKHFIGDDVYQNVSIFASIFNSLKWDNNNNNNNNTDCISTRISSEKLSHLIMVE